MNPVKQPLLESFLSRHPDVAGWRSRSSTSPVPLPAGVPEFRPTSPVPMARTQLNPKLALPLMQRIEQDKEPALIAAVSGRFVPAHVTAPVTVTATQPH